LRVDSGLSRDFDGFIEKFPEREPGGGYKQVLVRQHRDQLPVVR